MKIAFICLVIAFMTFCSCTHEDNLRNMIKREIKINWRYAQVNGKFSGKAIVPGTIHTDLLANKQIDDPFYRTNEKDLQWIDKEDWEYTTAFTLSEEEINKDNLVLDFKGLDTYADVYVNNQLLLKANNMFREWEVDIKAVAKTGENQLRIYFHSPIKKGLELLEKDGIAYPAINDQSENGELGNKKVSVFTRKAGYHYGWDWGPRFVTSGIWRPVYVKVWDDARIKNTFIKQPKVTAEKAELVASVTITASSNIEGKVIVINTDNGKKVAEGAVSLKEGESIVSLPFTIHHPQLWWSNGLGEAHLYHFKTELIVDNKIIASHQVATGIRSLKLVREKDAEGESFVFELNGVKVFAKGANYIPNDNFIPRVTNEDYEKVIADAVNANMNMLRVWGGGIYENDYFYELCDKNGLMVWQDFMFACSMYPGDKDFLDNVQKEAIDNVIRLRNHPCISLWCGNNEINTAWHYYSDGGWGWKERYSTDQRDEIHEAYLNIFHEILPKVVKEYTDGDDYWPSSPQAGFEPEKHAGYENTAGDMHYWGVWHGKHPFEDFDKYKARFMSEYGFQSFPDFETVKKYALPEDYDIESEVMAAHQRSGIGNLRIKEYMGWYYKVPSDFEQFLYMSHVLQARGIKMAIEAHRRAMPYCMGTLYWQINDCWPVASWSSTDYYHKWKAMHYMVRKAYEPVLLSAFNKEGMLTFYGVSDLLEDQQANLQLTLLNFEGVKLMEKQMDVVLKKNTSTVLFQSEIAEMLQDAKENEVVLHMELKQEDNLIADNNYYFAKPKDQLLLQPKLDIELVSMEGKNYAKVSTDKLVRDLYLKFVDSDIQFSDNYFDLLPGESKMIELSGNDQVDENKLKIMHLQQVQ